MSKPPLSARLTVWALVILLDAPIAITLAYSLAESWGAHILPQGFSIQWYAKLWTDQRFLAAFGRSLLVCLAALALSLVLILPALFVVFYYFPRLKGLMNLLVLVAIMSLFGATLTLPGLAGIVLTVGMSVDANVLINERIREELRAGLPAKAAIAAGYDRASGTIMDANITTILAGVALFAFGTGPIKGFAVSLIVGIAVSAYTAVSASRGIATLIYGSRRKLKTVAI